jgi:hypothetical protein
MRVFAISDIHADYRENRRWVHDLSMLDFARDALIVAGDISHDRGVLDEVLKALVERFSTVFFVPGNHDLWLRDGTSSDSLAKLHDLFAACAAHGVLTTPRRLGAPGDLDPVWVVPLFSWYDRPEDAGASLYLPKVGEDPTLSMWADSWEVQWPKGGVPRPALRFLDMNEARVDEVRLGPVITFSHFLPRPELMYPTAAELVDLERPLVDPVPAFNFSRVAGTLHLDDQLRRAGSLIHVYGHQHRNRRLFFDGVLYLSHCLGYPRERSTGRIRGVAAGLKLVWDTAGRAATRV